MPLFFKAISLTGLASTFGILVLASPVWPQGPGLNRTIEERVDLSNFAQVVTCDPNRIRGTLASRADEFPAEDLFLEKELVADADGCYVVPRWEKGVGCIGLVWPTGHKWTELSLQFTKSGTVDEWKGIQMQYWSTEGEAWFMHSAGSIWQGSWRPFRGTFKPQGDRLVFFVDRQDYPEGTRGVQKVRWLFPASTNEVVVRSLSAFSDAQWGTANLVVELEKPRSNQQGKIVVSQGELLSSTDSRSSLECVWDLNQPLHLKLRYCLPGQSKLDRTVVSFYLPEGAWGVAVDDVVANECVYIRDYGFFVAQEPATISLAEYRTKIVDKKTVLERVRQMPDQTFAQALETVHSPVQNGGPMMLSLACDNYKFVVQREGAIQFSMVPEKATEFVTSQIVLPCQIKPQFGTGINKDLTRHLDGGWLPIPVITVENDGVVYEQRTLVAPYGNQNLSQGPGWLKNRSVCVAEFTLENRQSTPRDVSLGLEIWADTDKNLHANLQQVGQGTIAETNGRLLAYFDTTEADSLTSQIEEGTVFVRGSLPGQSRARCCLYVPTWEIRPQNLDWLEAQVDWQARVQEYWQEVMAPAMQLEIPEPVLLNIIKASQVHCLMATRNSKDGEHFVPWIASVIYGPTESESNPIIHGMDVMGHDEYARRCLDFFISRYNSAGFLTSGYTLIGTGWHLLTVARHWEITDDRTWLQKVAPEVARVCRWVSAQREKTKKCTPSGTKVPEYGLFPPGVIGDWNTYTYRYMSNGLFCAGLGQAARALKAIDYPDADSLIDSADEFLREILRAYQETQARTPVLVLSNGTWVPGYPATLYVPGRTPDFFPGEDWGRVAAGDIESGAHHLAALEVMDPASREAGWMMDHMEDIDFLAGGWGEYPIEVCQKDWFNLGGFSKVQPYYTRNAEIYARRDDIKPFIRSYMNSVASLVSLENLSFWEHFQNQGAYNKTHETGSFLEQTRFLFVMECGENLWLAPMAPNNWFQDGMSVVVRNVPTHFGRVSYQISSHVKDGYLEAAIEPVAGNAMAALIIRLRHPEGKTIQAVTVNGQVHHEYDPLRECVRIKPTPGRVTIRAQY